MTKHKLMMFLIHIALLMMHNDCCIGVKYQRELQALSSSQRFLNLLLSLDVKTYFYALICVIFIGVG